MCLAADGLPYVDEPLECSPESAFCLEIVLKDSDVQAWAAEERPERLAHVAAVSKRARAEVSLKSLTPQEMKLFG